MKVLFFLFLGSLLFSNNIALPENTVALVNGTAISKDELKREVTQLIPRSYVHANIDEKKRKVLNKKALATLIDKTLLYTYAIKNNISASGDEIQSILSVFMNRYASTEVFNKVLVQSNFTLDTLKNSIKKDLILKKLYEKEIKFTLSDEELKNNYEKNRHKFLVPEKIKVSMIYVRNNPEDPQGKEKAEKRIKEAEQLLKKGENFAYVAQTYSDDPSRVMGGSLGYIHKGRLHPAIENIAFSLEVNSVSKVVVNDIGYYIVKVEDKKKRNQQTFEAVKDKLKKKIKKREEDKRKKELLERLMLNAVILK